jgi:hypothetical protein
MDSEAAGAQPEPGYPEIYVGPTCHVQTAESRVSKCIDSLSCGLLPEP